MNFKEWLFNLEEGGFCKKGACAYGGTVPTPSNRKPQMKVPTPKTAKIRRPHDGIHLYGLGGSPLAGGGGGGMSAPTVGGAPAVGAAVGGAPAMGGAPAAPPMGGGMPTR